MYPHMSNGSLEDVLGTRARRKGLNAEMRVRIALGVAHALDYLHTPWLDKPAIIHRDVKVKKPRDCWWCSPCPLRKVPQLGVVVRACVRAPGGFV